MQWYYASNGQRQGPVNQTEFERLIASGAITPETLVWRKPMPGWQTLTEVLAADPAAVTMSPPPLPGASTDRVAEVRPELVQQALDAAVEQEAVQAIRAGKTGPVVYGGFWRRVAARLIDAVILWFAWNIVVGVTGGLFFADAMKMLEKLHGQRPTPEQVMAVPGFWVMTLTVAVVLGLAYDCFFLGKYAATPGKLALGLSVRRKNGAPLSAGRIIARYFAIGLNQFTLGLSYLVVAFDDEKRGVHDCVCDTRVVRTER